MTEQEKVDTEIKRNKDVVDLLTTIRGNFKTITDLLDRKTMVTDCKEAYKAWLLQPLYENDKCSVGLVSVAKKELGPCEEHIHPDSVEYLIITKGRLLINMMNQNLKILGEGECVSIPARTPHYSVPMEDDTQMIYVTVPKDPYIPKVVKTVEDIFKEKEK
jgi:quercetin dioxygenase-like cupin family protein